MCPVLQRQVARLLVRLESHFGIAAIVHGDDGVPLELSGEREPALIISQNLLIAVSML